MKKCLKCNLEYTNDYIFCTKCGRALVEVEEDKPEIIETTFEEVSNQEVVEPHVQEQPHQTVSDEEIERYKKEIEVFKYRRKSMMIVGIVIAAIFFVATIVFGVLYGYHFAMDMHELIEGEVQISELTGIYAAMTTLSALLLDVGIALIILGILPNTIKIKNRERIIRNYRK